MAETRQSKMMFSTSEMLYLIGSLHLSYSLLLGDPFRGYSKEAMKIEIDKGRRALEDKGLLKKVSYSDWELDARIVSVFNVVASSDYSVFITSISNPAAIVQHVYYYKERQGISITLEGRFYHVSIYHDEQTMMDFLLPLLGINQQLSQGFPSFIFPAKKFAATLLTVWKDPDNASNVLQAVGLDEEHAKVTAGALAQVQNANILFLHPEPGTEIKKRIAYLMTSRTCLWWSEVKKDHTAPLDFEPLVYSHTAMTRALEYDEVLVTHDPSMPNVIAHVLSFVRGEVPISESENGAPPGDRLID
jgi:hypothetical protein